MPEKMMWVSWEEGAELSNSHKSPGDFSALTRDRDGRLRHAVLSEIDDEGDVPEPVFRDLEDDDEDRDERATDLVSDVLAKAAAEIVLGLIDRAVEAGKPHVAQWWKSQARPAITSAARTTRGKVKRAVRRTPPVTVLESGDEPSVDEPSTDMAVVEADRPVMTTAEAEHRLAAALVARAFSDEQISTVLNARVVDDEHRDVHLSLTEVPRAEVQTQVSQLLEANPTLLTKLIELFSEANHSREPALLQSARVPAELGLSQGDSQEA